MLAFMQSWFAPGANPVGVDFGTDCLRLAQVERVNGDFRLVAAACADVPSHVRNDPFGRLTFFSETLRDLWTTGNFRGRRAVLALPAASMFIQHLRIPKMDEDALKKALPWEARGKLPMDPTQALLRHLVAGEVYQDQEPKSEVILMAARKEMVEQLLAAAAKARLDVVGMNVEPKALIDCFCNISRRKTDAQATVCFVDIGCNASRAVIAQGTQVLFARAIPVGGEHFSKAVATALKIPLEEAKLMRFRLAGHGCDEGRETCADPRNINQSAADAANADADSDNSFALMGVSTAASATRQSGGATATLEAPPVIARKTAPTAPDESAQRSRIDQAIAEPIKRLAEELSLCRRYHESTFPTKPIDRLVFVGGEARHRSLCQGIARELGIAAQIGDPMVRMGRISDIGVESGIDRRLPQPAWSVAIGLTMGPPPITESNAEKAAPRDE
ncbi:MAG TPA: pilus assembly protein PilM [Tepidisphaeraceae bacterium]|nr:pilus assembly protein PilM [Tepidisphaeraceae bacterium]